MSWAFIFCYYRFLLINKSEFDILKLKDLNIFNVFDLEILKFKLKIKGKNSIFWIAILLSSKFKLVSQNFNDILFNFLHIFQSFKLRRKSKRKMNFQNVNFFLRSNLITTCRAKKKEWVTDNFTDCKLFLIPVIFFLIIKEI